MGGGALLVVVGCGLETPFLCAVHILTPSPSPSLSPTRPLEVDALRRCEAARDADAARWSEQAAEAEAAQAKSQQEVREGAPLLFR